MKLRIIVIMNFGMFRPGVQELYEGFCELVFPL